MVLKKAVPENAEDMDPDKNVTVKGSVRTVEFCTCKWNASLLAVGTESDVTIFSLKFPDEDSSLQEMTVEIVKKFDHKSPVCSLSWSPNMSLVMHPVWIRFATTGMDKNVRLFYSDLKNENKIELLKGHEDYVNDVAIDPHRGTSVASVSDDNSCLLWTLEGVRQHRFTLRSPGMSVRWHPDEPGKLMVAEKRGTVRFYNASSGQPLLSLETSPPLLRADWLLCNSVLVGAAAGSSCFLWDSSRGSRPIAHKAVHTDGTTEFRFSCSNEVLCATRGYPGNQVKVVNVKTGQVLLTHDGTVGQGVAWHYGLPVVAVGGDGRVHLYKINTA